MFVVRGKNIFCHTPFTTGFSTYFKSPLYLFKARQYNIITIKYQFQLSYNGTFDYFLNTFIKLSAPSGLSVETDKTSESQNNTFPRSCISLHAISHHINNKLKLILRATSVLHK